ncbi:hypothetical protein IJ21_17790 [Paenibacillus sp. 32O-W]|uniref:hypothetical protein n=1 Tax=Paenibacillus sp. 32O-W TaxID=1695218 RepID=UPI00071EE360|nr:hypothetical protein [Paenibacillus sp. 32O-W]ALS27180.1 hypothetical protein IJ21_17790 [Paenibacillus sp. 32O-W]
MPEWKDEVKEHIDAYMKKSEAIKNAIHKQLGSLRIHSIEGAVETVGHDPLWKVTIWTERSRLKVDFTISLKEIEEFEHVIDDYGQIVPTLPKDLDKAIQSILLRKIKERLPV